MFNPFNRAARKGWWAAKGRRQAAAMRAAREPAQMNLAEKCLLGIMYLLGAVFGLGFAALVFWTVVWGFFLADPVGWTIFIVAIVALWAAVVLIGNRYRRYKQERADGGEAMRKKLIAVATAVLLSVFLGWLPAGLVLIGCGEVATLFGGVAVNQPATNDADWIAQNAAVIVSAWIGYAIARRRARKPETSSPSHADEAAGEAHAHRADNASAPHDRSPEPVGGCVAVTGSVTPPVTLPQGELRPANEADSRNGLARTDRLRYSSGEAVMTESNGGPPQPPEPSGPPAKVVGGGEADPHARGDALHGLGCVTVAPGADRAGVALQPISLDFVQRISGVYGQPLTIATGTNHSRLTTTGNISDHWDGHGADIPASGATLTSLGRAALIAAGMSPAKAQEIEGGAFTMNYKGDRVQIIFNSNVGGDHWHYLHVGIRRASRPAPAG
jgi:hypothetical protein